MGTNYYAKINVCEHCGREENKIHLGKSSYGWQFSFQYNEGEYYKNYDEMIYWLRDKRIFDEYGDEITMSEFMDMVETKKKEKHNHAKEYPSSTEQVIGGYSFSDCKFS